MVVSDMPEYLQIQNWCQVVLLGTVFSLDVSSRCVRKSYVGQIFLLWQSIYAPNACANVT